MRLSTENERLDTGGKCAAIHGETGMEELIPVTQGEPWDVADDEPSDDDSVRGGGGLDVMSRCSTNVLVKEAHKATD